MTILTLHGERGLGPREVDRKGDWLCTFTGRQFYPLDPRPEDFCIEDIAHPLSQLCRFGGHCRRFYSIAEHSYRVLRFVEALPAVAMLPESFRAPLLLYALFHDAPEAYLQDIPRPLKQDDCMSGYREVERQLMKALSVWLGIMPNADIIQTVNYADNVLLCAEATSLMPAPSVARWHFTPEVRAVAAAISFPSSKEDMVPPWVGEMVFTAAYRRLALLL